MGSTITFASHGLVADQAIYFGNLVPSDCGIEEGRVYYVLATNLTADTFEFSETVGGPAFTLAFDITEGVVSPVAVYTAITDPTDVMAPPPAPAIPDDPILSSLTISGVVRLSVTLDSGLEETIRATEVSITHKFDASAVPEWDNGSIHMMPRGSADLTIPALGGTVYAVRQRFQDVFGNFSPYSNTVTVTTVAGADGLVAALADVANDIPDGIVTEVKIADNAITAPKIAANSISANHLAATIILASLVQTAESGRRVEFDSEGIRLYDTDETLLVRIPTNGDPVYVQGQINASDLVVNDSAEFRTVASLAADSIMTLQTGTSPPGAVPTLSTAMGSLALTSTPAGVSTAAGVWYDTGTNSYWIAADPDSGYIAHEYNGTTGALIRSIEATGSTSTFTDTVGSTSHVSDGADGYASSSTDNQFSSPLTMPRDGRITKISVYCAGRLGSVQLRNAVWSSGGGSLLRQSAWYTAASGGATAPGASDKHNISVTPLEVNGGTTYRVGFFKADGDSDGVQMDFDSGSGKTLYVGDNGQDAYSGGFTSTSKKINVYITYEYDVDTRLETAPNIGVATDTTYLYLLDNAGTLWKYLKADGSYVADQDLSASISGTVANAGLFYDATANELIITTTTGTGAGVYPKFTRVTPSTLAVAGHYSASAGTTFTGTTAYMRGGVRMPDPLNGNAATYWVCTSNGVVYAYTFSGSTATQTANRHFGTTSYSGSGLAHDGSSFRGWYNGAPTRFVRFTGWDFTTTSTTLWVGYSWYDSAGTTHETAMGPATSITIRRRERVIVQTPTIPAGGADDPNNCRVYMLQNATNTGAGTFWLQATHTGTSVTIESYTGSGTHDGAGTAFAAGVPAELKSSPNPLAGGWSLRGNGVWVPASGTSFPSSPTNGEHFFRTDLDETFQYTNSRWECTTLHEKTLRLNGTAHTNGGTLSATLSAVGRLEYPRVIGSDILIVDYILSYYIDSGGSALSASHKWTGQLYTIADGSNFTGTARGGAMTIDSGAASQTARQIVNVNTLGGSTPTHFQTNWTKTGTPGDIRVWEAVTYRHIAT